jgi:hypothetical protein
MVGLSRHRAGLSALLSAAVYKVKRLSIQITHPNRLFPEKNLIITLILFVP